jgi:hypothetical protein
MTTQADKAWINDLKDAYLQGASDVEICKILKMTQREFDSYYEKSPNFKEMVDIGRMMAKAWWYEQGRRNIENTKFNTTLWSFNMKNRYGWADKTENTSVDADFEDMDLSKLEQMLRKKAPSVLRLIKPTMTDAEIVNLDAN